VSGTPVVADLAKMPHLLIAGATGSGKSVCMNSVIAGLMMNATPEQVRFVMVDPKRVELTAYHNIPHLAFSEVIVDVDKVVGTLQAVVHEMESRYKKFAAQAVRNIESYNRHPRVLIKLPYWVIIIDELADPMMAAPFEVERLLCRLAQLARATGIHLVVATQRPSVDVVTGLIKANFPTRIAFAVTSQTDSHHPRHGRRREAARPRRHALHANGRRQADPHPGRLRLRRGGGAARRVLDRRALPRDRPRERR
jgi:S-DNA-T family DNA segregation ATPase FtsK/SpoIIIE